MILLLEKHPKSILGPHKCWYQPTHENSLHEEIGSYLTIEHDLMIIHDDDIYNIWWCIVGRWVRLCIKLPLRWCTRQSWCSQHFTHDPIRQPTPQPLMQPTLYTWSYIATVAYITTDYFKLHSCPTRWSLYCLSVLETWRQRFLDETEGGEWNF